MKKILKALLICLAITCFVCVAACGGTGSSSEKTPGAHYGTKGDEYILKSYVAESGVDTFVVDEKVTQIKKNAFADNNSIKKIVIKSMDVEIGAGAFANMKALEEIEISFVGATADAVNAKKTFAYIFGTESYDEGKAVTQTYNVSDETATYYVPKTLKKVTVNSSDEYELPAYAFNGMSNLTEIVLGEKVTSIGNNAFENCSALTKFVVPAAVKKIGDSAFVGCTGLRGGLGSNKDTDSFVFEGTNVTEIGDKAFYQTRLVTVVIPEGVKTIGEYCFASATEVSETKTSSVATVTLPDTLEEIGAYAFLKCTELTTVNFGTGLKNINVGAFAYCEALDGTVAFGENVTVWALAFSNTKISVSGSATFHKDWNIELESWNAD